jgi:hypothetical protein
MIVRLSRANSSDISALREERRRGTALGIVPVFYSRLVNDAEAHLIEEPRLGSDGAIVLGYVLTLERAHDAHSHVTTVELHLGAGHQHRYEDVLDLLRDELHPTAYLTRTDDCLYNATLLSRGHQVEPTALVMLWQPTDMLADSSLPSAELAPLSPDHMEGIGKSLDAEKDKEMLEELRAIASSGRGWTVMYDGDPVAVIARRDGGDGVHELLDFAYARASEDLLSRALEKAAHAVGGEGLRPAAVIDASEAARHRIFRGARFYTAASYLVYYDAAAGRPSVARITTAELRALLQRGDHFRLVDVLGEEHWKEGHLPGAEWIDFKGLGKQARRRFKPEESLVLYCNGFT